MTSSKPKICDIIEQNV